MSVRRYKLRFIAFIAVVALCSYGIYVAFSAQGQGRLAQAPLNTQTTTRTAFIMAVDDSNSMGFEVLTALGDLNLRWNNCSASFFSGSGVFFQAAPVVLLMWVACFTFFPMLNLIKHMVATRLLHLISSALRVRLSIIKPILTRLSHTTRGVRRTGLRRPML